MVKGITQNMIKQYLETVDQCRQVLERNDFLETTNRELMEGMFQMTQECEYWRNKYKKLANQYIRLANSIKYDYEEE